MHILDKTNLYFTTFNIQEELDWCHAGMKECPDSLPGPPVYRLLLLTTCLACLEVIMDSSGFYL